jgi:uncharacterized membrane protein
MRRLAVHVRNMLVAGTIAVVPVAIALAVVRHVDGLMRTEFGLRQPLVAVAITLVGLYCLGVVATSFAERLAGGALADLIGRVPGLRELYRAWRQLALRPDARGGDSFSQVVLVPDEGGRGCVLGLTSGFAIAGDPGLLCVYVPASPNPTSGKLHFIPTTRCIRIDMRPRDALRLIVSSGNYVPGAIGAATSGQFSFRSGPGEGPAPPAMGSREQSSRSPTRSRARGACRRCRGRRASWRSRSGRRCGRRRRRPAAGRRPLRAWGSFPPGRRRSRSRPPPRRR